MIISLKEITNTTDVVQSVEKPRFASKSGLNLCQIMPEHKNHAQ